MLAYVPFSSFVFTLFSPLSFPTILHMYCIVLEKQHRGLDTIGQAPIGLDSQGVIVIDKEFALNFPRPGRLNSAF
jgi:hypothetical protein